MLEENYYERLMNATKDSRVIIGNFFKTLNSRLDKDINDIDVNNAEECIKYAGRYHLSRLITLKNIIEVNDNE